MNHLNELIQDFNSTMDPVGYIESLESGAIPALYEWQQMVLLSYAQFIHINGARRAGKSVIISCIPTHLAKSEAGSVTLILGPTQTQANEDMRLIKGFISHDDEYPEMVRVSDQQIELKNGSRIIVVPATEVSARGYPDPDLIITDEAAFIEDMIHRDCLSPMLSENPNCKWLQISTTNGKKNDPGKFFYECSLSPKWERYEVRAPYQVDPQNNLNLIPYMPEEEYKAKKAADGIRAFYSPRHRNIDTQLMLLSMQGSSKYKRNQLAEFVESADTVFSYEDIKRALDGNGSRALVQGLSEAKSEAILV